MNEMINATTSLLPILTLGGNGNLYYNISVGVFSIIATVNHLFPENLGGTTHIVKLLVSNILFSLLGIDPRLGFAVSLLDLTPLFVKNKTMIKFGELLIQVPRQLIDLYLIYKIGFEMDFLGRSIFIILSKIVYYSERRLRIKRGERNNFYFFHCFEHLGLYTLLSTLVNSKLIDIYAIVFTFLLFICAWSLIIFSITLYLYLNYEKRVPAYIKKDDQMMAILKRKITRNLFEGKLYNYICKPWTTHLKMEIITWSKIESCCEELAKSINPEEIDLVVGIATGGVFVAACIGKLINRPVKIINSKLWSGISFYENGKRVSRFFSGKEVKPEISGIPDLEGKRILLCDDTTYTGLTMKNCIDWSKTECKAKEVKTLIIWIHKRFIPDYYIGQKRVPIIWEWGAEVD